MTLSNHTPLTNAITLLASASTIMPCRAMNSTNLNRVITNNANTCTERRYPKALKYRFIFILL